MNEKKSSKSQPPSDEELLDEGFALREPKLIKQLEEMVSQQLEDEAELHADGKALIDATLDAFLAEVRDRGAKFLSVRTGRLDACKRELAKGRLFLEGLKEDKRKAITHLLAATSSKIMMGFYCFFYLILLTAAVLIYSSNFQLVFPDLTQFTGILSSFVLAGVSFLIARLYHDRSLEKRETFARWVNILSLAFCVLMAASFSISRFLAYLIINRSATISPTFWSQNPKTDLLVFVQSLTSALAFFGAAFAEMALTGSLALYLSKHVERHKPVRDFNREINDAKKEVEALEAEEKDLVEQIEQAELDEDLLEAWARKKQTVLQQRFKTIIARVHEEIYTQLRTVPLYRLKKAMAMVGNGNPKKGKLDETLYLDQFTDSIPHDSDGR